MKTTIQKPTLDFLRKLKKNNDRAWFEKNKPAYLAAKENMEGFVASLIAEFAKTDKSLKGLQPKDCLFRIYRDVRFAKDKKPYKTSFGAVIGPGGRKSDRASFYIHVEPGGSFIAGGRWNPSPEHLKDIRKEIFYNTAAFKRILRAKPFLKHFGELSDTKLTLAPKGFDKTFPDIELLKYTSYIVESGIEEKTLLSSRIYAHCRAVRDAMKPLLKFLDGATH
jgi:uncharacterized protein (TIGR02453 family)